MTQALGQLRIDLTSDWADFRTQMDRAADGLGRFGTRFAGVAANVGKAAGAMTVAAAGAFTTFAVLSVQAAEEAEGIAGAFRASFGDAAASAEEWAERVRGSLRLSNRDIQEAATGFQNLFAEIAPTNDAAAEASMRFVTLARDFAALKNIRFEDALRLVQSGLTGSGRALRAYGIDISEARVRAEALTAGVITQNQELSNEQAVLIRAAILTRELGTAQGATAASTDDAEAATQRARAAYEDASDSLGQSLLPAMTTLKNLLADAFRGFNEFTTKAIPDFLTSNDEVLARMVHFREILRGNFHSLEEVRGAVTRYRQTNQGTAAENAETTESIRGLSTETSAYADSLIALAAQSENGGNRGGGRQRSWAEQHASDIERLRESIDPVGSALARFNEQSAIATRAGLDLAAVQRQLALSMIESLGGVDAVRASLETLPPAFRAAAAEMETAELADQLEEYRQELERFAEDLNARFDGDSALKTEIESINDAFARGLISIETYKEAIREVTGQADEEAVIADKLAQQAQERDKQWSNFARTVGDVAAGTRDAEEAAKALILQWARAQLIEPFLNRLFQGGKSGGGMIGGLFSGSGASGKGGGGGFDWGGLIGSIFGGFRADGGGVNTGMAYEVGERGRELFVPSEDGMIIPHGKYGQRTVVQNIYTPNVSSFRLNRRQLRRDEQRALA